MEYDFGQIEKKWREKWKTANIYHIDEDSSKPKFYVLDMFPYPSGAGLHVGHPMGYIASDIYSRYKRQCGFNVLHPMGYDSFGLPAEQYAIQTGQHPAITTEKNIEYYRTQLDQIGFSYDPEREIDTSDPKYYHWTQWAFIKMFESYYCNSAKSARPITELVETFGRSGSKDLNVACGEQIQFTAAEWSAMSEQEKEAILHNFRLAFRADTMVNWCEALGTVLANDEVINGVSERGGHPVIQKRMTQWQLRVTAYAERLLGGLNDIDWSESLKEIQRNWIGRSEGAQLFFDIVGVEKKLEVFTTRPDTIFGSSFMVIAPEHEYVKGLTTPENKSSIESYVAKAAMRSERERMMDTKSVSGAFTGSYALNPFNNKQIPIYISDYVLAGYGTGAIMAVPAHDSRDYAFAKHFALPIIPVVDGGDVEHESYDAKQGRMINSEFIDGLEVEQAIEKMLVEIEARGIGKRRINYRLRDAIFSRQRYWGEPFPIFYKEGIAHPLPLDELPLKLPEVDQFKPTESGEPPLARAKNWKTKDGYPLETSTMPGFAGSSAYFLRYMDPHNDKALVGEEANKYWRNVDLYMGGIEHATGHLIYSRFWNKFLFDIGEVCEPEPFKKLVNQGMIQGRSSFVYRIVNTNKFVSHGLKEQYETQPIHVDVNIVENDVLDLEAFRNWRPDLKSAEFILEQGRYICGWAVEKMSKSMFNVVNPNNIIEKYGADTLRMYEMFLGPLEQSKPWDTNGIDGVHRFLRRFWRLFTLGEEMGVTDEKATKEELKILHRTIQKVGYDIGNFSFNTSISAFMICLNELGECNKREILDPLVRLLYPFAPHITEELWQEVLGNKEYLFNSKTPELVEEYLIESNFEYPVSFNGKMRFKLELPLDMDNQEIEKQLMNNQNTQRLLEGRKPKKIIIVKGRIINIVV